MKTCLKVLFLGSMFAIVAAICLAGQRAPEYLRVSIFIEKGADNFIPQSGDFIFRSQGQILPIEAVDAVPNDAPVFLIINADSLDVVLVVDDVWNSHAAPSFEMY